MTKVTVSVVEKASNAWFYTQTTDSATELLYDMHT